MSNPGAHSAIPEHARLAITLVGAGHWFTYSLWYPLVYIAVGMHDVSDHTLQIASVVLLTCALLAKSVIVYGATWQATRSRLAAFAVGLILLFAMPLFDPWRPLDIYLGQITANVWFDSTSMFALPFAIAAFLAATGLLRDPTRQRAAVFSCLVALSVAAKPNYALALLPVVGIMLLVVLYRRRTGLLYALQVVAIGFVPVAVLLVAQYSVTFASEGALRPTSIVIRPFEVWAAYSPDIPWSLLLSVAGPAVALLVMSREQRRDPGMVLAWGVLALAVAQMSLLAESANGVVDHSGNFFWGAYMAIFMVFLSCSIAVAQKVLARPRGRQMWLTAAAVLLLAAHALSGAYYAARAGTPSYPVFGSYQLKAGHH